jgi:hypothetical protein
LAAAQPGLTSALTAALVGDGFPVTATTTAQQAQYQSMLQTSGFPPEFLAAAQLGGTPSATISQWMTEVETATTFNSSNLDVAFNTAGIAIDAPNVDSALTTMATGNDITNISSGHSISGSGKYKESSGTTVGFTMKGSYNGFTKKIGGTFSLTDSSVNPTIALSKLPVIHAVEMGTSYAMIDGTYTDSSGQLQSFVEVAYVPSGGTTANHLAVGLSTGYSSNGKKTTGVVTIK